MAEKIIHNNPAKMKRKPKRARLLSMDECQHRPCEVDGRPALFHRWIEEDCELVQVAGLFNEVVHHTFALVEYQDGTIATVKPELIRFTDRTPKP